MRIVKADRHPNIIFWTFIERTFNNYTRWFWGPHGPQGPFCKNATVTKNQFQNFVSAFNLSHYVKNHGWATNRYGGTFI